MDTGGSTFVEEVARIVLKTALLSDGPLVAIELQGGAVTPTVQPTKVLSVAGLGTGAQDLDKLAATVETEPTATLATVHLSDALTAKAAGPRLLMAKDREPNTPVFLNTA